ncbi:transcriptional repressor [Desulfatibacillum aliphaticivorans]|uniref:Ferric uptake regulation protein n=1 Tax=Desulfatibacillum aliphaticivorans TaxID=218208 RepID=B8FAP2_DESAL|nr:transcriptional repressor [Desulfatibacillum aliphaticivorans]ACL03338.1 ferric uptake regulator, Fur family [Desulfatibacillum aliphaticivorans]
MKFRFAPTAMPDNCQSVHSLEEKQFARLFSDEGIEDVEDRLAILRVFLETEDHITSVQLMDLLEKAGYNFDPDFVRETLRLMCRYGFACKHDFEGRNSTYEHLHLGQHHDHMICTKCGSITEFVHDQLEAVQKQAAASYGFHMLQHRLEIYGLCSKCYTERVTLLPLAMAKVGEKAVIKDTTGCAKFRHRLLTMGLRTGDALEVITSDGRGQVVVSVEGRRMALGRGLAQKILVEPVNGNR